MKTGKKIFLLLIILGIFLRCSIDKPVLPRWVVPIVIPIAPEKLIFQGKILQDSTIVLHGDSLFLEFQGKVDPQSITSEQLSIPGVDTSTTFSLDTLKADSLNTLTTGYINISELLPNLGQLIGFNVPLPDTTLSSSAIIDTSSQFQAAKIRNGTLELTLRNDLPFTLAPNSSSPNGVEISLYNDETGELITSLAIPDTIYPHSTGVGSTSLNDVWVRVPIRLEYKLPILEDTIYVTQDSIDVWGFQIDLKLIGLEIDEIIGKVDMQFYKDSWRVPLDQENKVIEADIESGNIQLEFLNEIPLRATVNYWLLDLLDSNGDPYHGQFTIDSNSVVQENIVLDGYSLVNSDNPGQLPLDSLVMEFEIQTDSSTEFIHLRASDQISASIHSTEIRFSYLKGYLAKDTLSLDPFEENDIVDYDGFNGGIQLENAELILEIKNDIYIDTLLLNLTIIGYHRDDNGVITDSAMIQLTDERINTGGSDIIALQGAEVAGLINILPTDIKGYGSVVYSGEAEVEVGDSIAAKYFFSTPFKFRIVNMAPVEMDPDTLYDADIDEDLRTAAGDDIRAAILRAKVLNHSPLGGEVKIFVSADMNHQDIYDTTYFNPDLEFIKHIVLSPASTDPSTGFVTEAQESEIEFGLNTRELRVFRNPPIRIGFWLKIADTNGFVVLRGSDYLQLSGEFEINLLVKDDD